LQVAKAAKTVAPELTTEHLRRFLSTLREHRNALARYRFDGAYPGRVALFQSEQGAGDGVSEYARRWSPLLSAAPEVITVAGDHFAVLKTPQVQGIAEALKRACEDR
jgi:thioesterase domain-containing protein